MKPVTACLSMFVWFVITQPLMADVDPVVHWAFDDGSGNIAIDEMERADAELINEPTWTAGAVGGALSFDGTDDYAVAIDYVGVSGMASRTCCAWIRTIRVAQGRGGPIISWGSETEGGKWMFGVNQEGCLSVGAWGGYIQSVTQVDDGQWHHIAAVLHSDGTPAINEVLLYIDGVRVSTFANNTQIIDTVTAANVEIGRAHYTHYSDDYFPGLIDDVRIYDIALTTRDIQELVSLKETVKEPILFASWNFDEGDGIIAEDAVGDLDAVLYNQPEWTEGRSGYGLNFDGVDDYAVVSGTTGIIGKAARTCSAWIKTTSNQAGCILDWGQTEPGQKWMFLVQDSGMLAVGVWNGFVSSAQVVNDGIWHHVAAVLYQNDAAAVSDVLLYIDGVLQTDIFYSNAQPIDTADAQDVLIGAVHTDQIANFFQGKMDEVRIYASALTSEQIKTLSGIPSELTNWTFDEGKGQMASDSVDSADGVLKENPLWVPGVVGSALAFDGTDSYVEVPDFAGITGTRTRTCCAWIRTAASQAGAVLSWGIKEPGQKWTLGVTSEGTLRIGMWTGYTQTIRTVNDGFWHHVAVVLTNDGNPDSSRPLLYIDGIMQEQIDSSDICMIDTSGVQNVMIGASFDDGGYNTFFSGMIDDVRIYPVALDAGQIREAAGLDFVATLWVDDDYQSTDYLQEGQTASNDGHVWGVNAFDSIQNAIDHASYGTTIHVAPGRYLENIVMVNGIKLLGADPAITIIDGRDGYGWQEGSHAVVACIDCDENTLIEGFTLTNGYGTSTQSVPGYVGGGVYCEYSDLTIKNCRIHHNTAYAGGGLYAYFGSLVIDHCVISENTALEFGGGGIYSDNSNPVLLHCSVSDNHANGDGGGALKNVNGDVEIADSILWDNASTFANDEIMNEGSGLIHIRYSDIAGSGGSGTGWDLAMGIDEGGNIDTDPLFGGFYRLLSPAGRYQSSQNALWVYDEQTSPCIDAGDPRVIVYKEPMPNGGFVNMGAYGGTEQASKSYFGTDCEIFVVGDLDGDCRVNLYDCSILASHWLEDHRLSQ